MGTTALNMHERMDGLLYALVHPQKPMVTTRVLDLVHFDEVRRSIAVSFFSADRAKSWWTLVANPTERIGLDVCTFWQVRYELP